MVKKNIVITESGLEKLQKELEDLKHVRRPEVINRIKAAKELGDLSENAEYAVAKEDQSFIEGRIQEIEQIVKQAKIVTHQTGSTIQAGSNVKVKVEGEDLEFEIVGPTESDPANGLISLSSPVGMALVGRKAGESVSVETPDGKVSYKIITVS